MGLPERPRFVITGAASGLGRALALEVARRKGRVLAADVDLDGLAETVRLVGAAGGEAHAVPCDVTDPKDVLALVDQAERVYGGADVIVNNAGVAVGGDVGEVPLEDWTWIVGINLLGVIYGCHAFVPVFKRRGSGHILNVASAAGLMSAPKMAPYNVTKAGVVALSETLSVELRGHGVGVTVLCPTFFRTNIAASARKHGDAMDAEMVDKLMDRSKLQAPEVARFALDAVDRGDLFAVPHRDGRAFWRLKRVSPELYQTWLVPRLVDLAQKKRAKRGE